ncbi:hypothetical protein F5Y11DRAFT_330663 [Daldinia sp. FL1419]|nr:hypothetical protein F5Y11DRAFT_330663 [Daldinia sp. FL1419]
MKAAAQSPKQFNNPASRGVFVCFRPAILHFFRHHPDLLSLQLSANVCDLCACMWQSYTSNVHPNELFRGEFRISHSHIQLSTYFATADQSMNSLLRSVMPSTSLKHSISVTYGSMHYVLSKIQIKIGLEMPVECARFTVEQSSR